MRSEVATAPENSSRRMTPFVEDPYETMPIIDAYYEREKMWFAHTDVSNEQMARRLTMMVAITPSTRPVLSHSNCHNIVTTPTDAHGR